jgi:small subunit ribosomal protein S2
MRRYIFTQRNGIHIIDLQQTMGLINDAYRAMVELAAGGGKVLFVGTKKQAQDVISSEAERAGQWYVNQRWLGGTLTNFQTIKGRIDHMKRLQEQRDTGYLARLPKKEVVRLTHTLDKLEKYFTGLRNMDRLPSALFVIDIGKEDICIAEARRLNIPIFAIVDTDCDPGQVTHAVPGNDDAVRSIRLITGRMATAIEEGQAQREALQIAQAESDGTEEEQDEDAKPFSSTVTLEELGQMMSSRPLEP